MQDGAAAAQRGDPARGALRSHRGAAVEGGGQAPGSHRHTRGQDSVICNTLLSTTSIIYPQSNPVFDASVRFSMDGVTEKVVYNFSQ